MAGAISSLAGLGGIASAGAAPGRSSAEGPVELSPCLLWGDVLPVELTRFHAREAILCLLNQERAQVGLSALDLDRRLQRASQRHTAQMDGTGCFTHRCPGERRLEARLSRYLAGQPRMYRYGEVIAWAPARLASPRQIVDGLMGSALHRAHILKPIYEEAGVGYAPGTPWSALAGGGIYTVDFGMRAG